MSRFGWFGLLLLGCFSIGVALDRAVMSGQEIATVTLSIPILIVAALTLWFTIPKRAKIKVERFSEADLTDLIFYTYPQSDSRVELEQPVDYLLQLHVVISNLGDRKAIVSAIRVEGFRNNKGDVVHLPDASETIGGMRWVQQSGWVNHQMHFQNISDPPPYVLDHDDALVIRFRVRRGIDWSSRWNLEALHSFIEPLRDPIVSAFGIVIWRRAGEIICEQFDVEVTVKQQSQYVGLVEELTNKFTVVPDLPERPFPLE